MSRINIATKTFRHLSLDNRIALQEGLNQGERLKDLARRAGKDPSSLSREIRRNRMRKATCEFNRDKWNNCLHRKSCQRHHVCSDTCKRRCSACPSCNRICPDFSKDECPTLLHFPFVCNNCQQRKGCRRDKFLYNATLAHVRSQELLRTCRTGINLTQPELESLDLLLTPLIQRGQALNHIVAVHREDLPCSKRSLYRYVDQGILAVRNIDLPRKVCYKKRKTASREPADFACRQGRTFSDFLIYTGYQPDLPIVEMDTLIGRNGGKALLTLLFRQSSFMLIFLLAEKTKAAVLEIFDNLELTLGPELFQAFFPVILTDNGSEFKDPFRLKTGLSGKPRCRIFFCDPMASWQKGRLEKNHEYIRYVLPKGTSFDDLSQDDVDLLMNHINCTCRDILDSCSPFDEAWSDLYDLFERLPIYRVPADRICLKPVLLKR